MRLHTHVLTRDLAKIFDNCSIIIISGRMKRERERSIKKGREQRKKGEFRIGRETKRERHKQQEREKTLWPPSISIVPRVLENHLSFSFWRRGSQALDLTQSWGSFKPRPDVVPSFLISRLSRIRRFDWRVLLFLLLKVAMILGSSQLMVPLVQWRACLEIPEMFSSSLVEVVSWACCFMRVRKLTRVWPMYLLLGLQLHTCS